jgi:hypothetical protein
MPPALDPRQLARTSRRAASIPSASSGRWDTRAPITMDLYVHEFEIARRREQVGDRLVALGGAIPEEI